MVSRLRLAHLAPLLVFFVMGLAAFDSVSQTFFVRNSVHLSAAQLIEIGIWTQLPWSVKIFFGSVIDSFRLFGNNRRSYIYLGSLFWAAGVLSFLAFVSGNSPVASEYTNLLVSGLLTTIGIVFAQSTANALTVELVEPEDIGRMQVAIRFAMASGAVIAAASTGFLAARYTLTEITAGKLVLPVLLLLGTALVLRGRRELGTAQLSPQWRLIGLSVAFAAFCVLSGSQLLIFVGQMLLINYLLFRLSLGMPWLAAKTFLLSCLAIFLFRVSPDVGPGFSWWIMGDVAHGGLAFDETYMGHLRLASTVVDIVALAALSGVMAQGRILRTLTTLTIVGAVVSIPAIAVYYGLHDYIGVSPRTVFLVDTAVGAPLADLSMIPLGILIARNAPAEGRAMYMAVTASFMNMALLGGDLMTRGLNVVYEITRTDYSQLGMLLLVSTGIGLALSAVGLLILKRVRST